MLSATHVAALALLAVTAFSLQTERMVLASYPMFAQMPAPSNPAAVFQSFQDARNQGDVEGAMKLVANDMTYVGGHVCTHVDPCVGGDTFRREVELSVSNRVQSATLGDPSVSGATVHVTLMSTSPDRMAIGVERTLSEVTAEALDGKLVSFRSDADGDDLQTLWWLDRRPVGGPELLATAHPA